MQVINSRIIIIAALLSILSAGTVLANPSVDLGSISGSPCASVIIPITLTNDGLAQVAATSNDIGYNSTYLTPVNATIGPAGQAAGKNIIKNIVRPGLYRVGVMSTADLGPINTGIVAYVTFEINCSAPAGTYQLSNVPKTSSPNALSLATDGSGGSIAVSAAATTTTTIGRKPVAHIKTCMVCHASSVHTPAAHNACENCHVNGAPPEPKNCVVCHPVGSASTCNLADFHNAPGRGGDCMNCHTDCTGGAATHISLCVVCHSWSSLHGRSGHSDCSKCHNGAPAAGNVAANTCIACHPLGNTGSCNLVDMHDPGKGASCLDCHMSCSGGSPAATTTSTTAQSGTTTINSGGGTSTSTTSITGSGSTTTTTLPGGHTGMCLSCHMVGDLHSRTGHTNCAKCHSGTPGKGNVDAGSCTACHPLSSPGKASLINNHGGNCVTCHAPTPGVSTTPTTRPTTSIPGAGSTTTTVPGGHTGLCLTCHFVVDLHGSPGHTNCAKCHSGTPGKGNVDAASCAACHPLIKPGKTDLINNHGGNCVTCHAAPPAISSTTTSTSGGPSTTTTILNGHVQQCISCHTVSDIHARSGHGTCSTCHSGAPGKGTVSPINCTQCHPLGKAGKCNLVETHGATCLQCHSTCAEGTTTSTAAATTTTTIPNPPPPTTTTTVTAGICPLKNILGEQNQSGLNIFRAFRDQRLSASPEGLAVTYLYYKHGRETGEILRSNNALMSRAASLVQEMRPLLAGRTKAGDTVTITVRQYQEAADLLRGIQLQASPRLRESISFILRLLDNGGFLRQMRVEVQKQSPSK